MSLAPTSSPLPAIARFPVSAVQRQMWFMDQITPGDLTLNVAVRWQVRGTLRAASLEAAFQEVIARHEILRTRFVELDGEPVQEVVESVPFRLSTVDLRTTPAAQHAARLDEIAAAETGRSFDLTQPGLIRATLVRLSAERAVLLVTAHHIVFDGTSIGVLGHEIGTLAAGFEAGTPADLPGLELQYGDYALWQREYLASGVETEDAAYWADRLRGAPYFEVPPDKPRAPLRSTAITRIGRDLPDAVIEGLKAVARAGETSFFSLGAAVAGAVLHRVTGADEVLMSTPIAGRVDIDLEPLIGPFIGHHILRLPTPGARGFGAHLAETRAAVEGAIAHQALPFSKLIELLNPPRDAARAPLTGVGFNLLEAFHRDACHGGFELLSAPSFAAGSAQDLNVLMVGRGSQPWRLSVEYCPDLFEAATAEALLSSLAAAFETVARGGATTLDALPLDPALAGRAGGVPRPFAALEAVLAAHPEVGAAAAVPTEDDRGYAFVSPRPDSLAPLETLPAELMGYAARRLDAGQMPVGVSVLASLPRTASGDIDRARLPRPVRAAPAPTPTPAQAFTPVPAPAPAPGRPVKDLEGTLETIWADLLDRAEIPRDVSFFDLGGHSLLAVRLMARIRQTWGAQLGVATLYTAPTLTGLAARLKAEIPPDEAPEEAPDEALAEAPPASDDWRIEPLITEGTGQPIIGVNDVALTLDMAQALAAPHRATCVRLFDGTRGIDDMPRSFEDIAAEYARTMRRAQPEGPYLLFGVCVHGNIALEAARILAAEGAEIAGVVIKDVWEPGYAAGIKDDPGARWAERRFALANKIRMVRAGTLSLSAMLGSYRLIRRTGVLQLAAKLGLIERVRASDLAPEQERFVSYISAARNRYRPEPLDLPVLHVVTRITPSGRHFLPSVGWEKIVAPGRLTTVRLDEVVVKRGISLGTRELAQEVEAWLAGRGRG